MSVIESKKVDALYFFKNRLDYLSSLKEGQEDIFELPNELSINQAEGFLKLCGNFLPEEVNAVMPGGISLNFIHRHNRVKIDFYNDGEVFALFQSGKGFRTEKVGKNDLVRFFDKVKNYL